MGQSPVVRSRDSGQWSCVSVTGQALVVLVNGQGLRVMGQNQGHGLVVSGQWSICYAMLLKGRLTSQCHLYLFDAHFALFIYIYLMLIAKMKVDMSAVAESHSFINRQ